MLIDYLGDFSLSLSLPIDDLEKYRIELYYNNYGAMNNNSIFQFHQFVDILYI